MVSIGKLLKQRANHLVFWVNPKQVLSFFVETVYFHRRIANGTLGTLASTKDHVGFGFLHSDSVLGLAAH